MLGAIIGDISGSIFEHAPIKTKNFTLLSFRGCFTDDTVMTVAVAKALLESGGDPETFEVQCVNQMQALGKKYSDSGYGMGFYRWLHSKHPSPYNSYGNGSAMRVSPVGFWAKTLEEALELAKRSARVTHDHPEGIKGAQAVAGCIFLAGNGASMEEIRSWVQEHFYPLSRTLDLIRPDYSFDVSCQGSVPEAIECFLSAADFEDAIRNAISLGGDADTQAAIAGSIAERYFGIPLDLKEKALQYLPEDLKEIMTEFYEAISL